MSVMRHRSGKAAIVVVLILAIIASVVARRAALAHRGRSTAAVSTSATGKSLSAMNSYAIALLLGGLRGPLVMFLWPSSEGQKADRNLEDFDTKIEWIRLLQAEFDTVHIFQIWNKAYNISVQMANVANKYTTILDALDYAHSVDSERPNNVNIISAIGGIYFDKFGNSQEKNFYKRHVRAETLPHVMIGKSRDNQAVGGRRLQLDPKLDANGNILPELLKPGTITLTDTGRNETYNGAELQFLERFQPFPNGLSPFAIAYNYYKRAQILQEAGKQRHAQLSDLVVDSRPALALKNWAEDELWFGRRMELAMLGKPNVDDHTLLDGLTAELPGSTALDEAATAKARSAIAAFDAATRIAPAADLEYQAHTARYSQNIKLYQQHRESVLATGIIAAGDRDFLSAIIESDPAKKQALFASAIANYEKAIDAYSILVLRYETPPDLVEQLLPPGTDRLNVDKLDRQQRLMAVAQVKQLIDNGVLADQAEDLGEYMRPIGRAEVRIKFAAK